MGCRDSKETYTATSGYRQCISPKEMIEAWINDDQNTITSINEFVKFIKDKNKLDDLTADDFECFKNYNILLSERIKIEHCLLSLLQGGETIEKEIDLINTRLSIYNNTEKLPMASEKEKDEISFPNDIEHKSNV